MDQPADAASGREPTSVGFILIPDFPLMAYAAALEPLRAANILSGRLLYRWWHASPGDKPAQSSIGVSIVPDVAVGAPVAGTARVFVCAGGNPSAFDDPALSAWLRRLSRDGAAVGGLSGGPYILARAGLLDGRRCTLHWEHIPAFRERFPKAEVARSLFEIDGDRVTCSGGTAALDMMLALVGRDHGPGLAAAVGDWFLHNRIREGPEPQRMTLQQRTGIRDPRLLRALAAMEAHLDAPLPRAALAALAHVSVRQLDRLFADLLGSSPHRHYLGLRLERAQKLHRETALCAAEIAAATGFLNADELARARRRMGDRACL